MEYMEIHHKLYELNYNNRNCSFPLLVTLNGELRLLWFYTDTQDAEKGYANITIKEIVVISENMTYTKIETNDTVKVEKFINGVMDISGYDYINLLLTMWERKTDDNYDLDKELQNLYKRVILKVMKPVYDKALEVAKNNKLID